MDFTTYCESKKIDAITFKASESERFAEWEYIYNQTGAVSFTQQKLFMINDIRRRYKLEKPMEAVVNNSDSKNQIAENKPITKPAGFKPKFK